MGKAFIQGRLQGVVRRIGNRILGKDAAKDGDSVSRAAGGNSSGICAQRIALGGRITTQPDKSYAVWCNSADISSSWNKCGAIWAVRKMQTLRRNYHIAPVLCGRYEERGIRKILAARTVAEHGVQIQAGLRVSVVQIVGREQPM